MNEESIKLYEYEQIKPELDKDSIEHFGILGMHWGRRNGPPYPLNSKISTGRRLKKGSGGSGSISRKRRKALKKARKARAQNAKARTLEKKTKEEIIKNKDIKSMLSNVDKFTNQEINDMLTRLDTEQRLRNKVSELERANKSTGQKFKEGFKSSVKEGLISGGKQVTKTVAKNAVKIGTKNLAKKLGEGDEQYQELINKLFREEKK